MNLGLKLERDASGKNRFSIQYYRGLICADIKLMIINYIIIPNARL